MKLGTQNTIVFLSASLLYILCFTSYVESTSKELPMAIRPLRCPIKGNFTACFLKNGNKAIPLLAKGDPSYGIPNMIPLLIPFIGLISTPNLQLNLTNVEVYGLNKMELISLTNDLKRNLYVLTLKAENITVVGDYEANGRILVMPLKGKGRFNFYFKNGIYKSSNAMKIIEKDGAKYYHPEDSRLEAKFEKIRFNFENMFDGDKKLGDEVNNFLNDNWETLYADFGPTVENTVAGIIKNIFAELSSRVPIDHMFA